MRIDWFTVIAQAVNFLVLMAILKFLLFDRIVAAVDTRKARLAAEEQQAEAARSDAQAELARAENTRKEVEDAREQHLREAKNTASERRRALEEEARQDIERMRERFRAGLREQQRQLVTELVRTSAEGVTQVARRALEDLADTDLDQRMVKRFCRRLRQSDESDRAKLEQVWGRLQEPLVVRSSRELGAEERADLVDALRAAMPGGHVDLESRLRYQVTGDFACGIEISGAGRSLGWSFHSYLSEVEDRLHAALEEEDDDEAHESAAAEPRAGESREVHSGEQHRSGEHE